MVFHVNNRSTYAGGYLHADHIRTLANSLSSMEAQIEMVSSFAAENFLKLNETKCQVVICRKSTSKTLSSDHFSDDGDIDCRLEKKASALDTCENPTFPQPE